MKNSKYIVAFLVSLNVSLIVEKLDSQHSTPTISIGTYVMPHPDGSFARLRPDTSSSGEPEIKLELQHRDSTNFDEIGDFDRFGVYTSEP